MIKARAVAGDIAAGELFLRRLRPFVWRKHLDFAAIQDIHSIKRQIHAVKGHRDIAVGRPQHQARPRRHPRDRVLRPDPAADLGRPQSGAAPARHLHGASRPWSRPAASSPSARPTTDRRLPLPAPRRASPADDRRPADPDPAGDRAGARRLRRASSASTRRRRSPPTLLRHLGTVEDHYAELFEEAPPLGRPRQPRLHRHRRRSGDGGDARRAWASPTAPRSRTVIRGWHHGRYRAMRSTRARELLTELMPQLLDVAGAHRQSRSRLRPLRRVPRPAAGGRAALLPALRQSRPARPDRRDHGQRAAAGRASEPQCRSARGGAGAAASSTPLPDRRTICARSSRGAASRPTISRTCWTSCAAGPRTASSRWACASCATSMGADAAGEPLADIADTAIAELQPAVEAEFARASTAGCPGAGWRPSASASSAAASCPSPPISTSSSSTTCPRATTRTRPGSACMSDGRKPLAPMHYYARLAQRLINAHHRADRRGPALRGRHAPAALRQSGPIASSARRLPALPDARAPGPGSTWR